MSAVYYIYTLTDPIDKEIKYIGKTKDLNDRLKRHMCDYNLRETWTRKNKWLKYLKNHGLSPIIEVLVEGTKENIDELEKFWIFQFRFWGFNLKNETDGGDGCDWTGRKHKPESIKKMKMNHPFRKTICQYEIGTDRLISEYNSAHEIQRETGYYRGHIVDCCKGTRTPNSAYGYYWRFKDNYFPYVESTNKPIKVQKYDMEWNLIYEYSSFYQAKKDKYHHIEIKKSIEQNKPYKGFYWKVIKK